MNTTVEAPSVRTRILQALEDYHPLSLTADDLAAETESTRKTIQTMITSLIRNGQVRRESVRMYDRGAPIPHYWLANEPELEAGAA